MKLFAKCSCGTETDTIKNKHVYGQEGRCYHCGLDLEAAPEKIEEKNKETGIKYDLGKLRFDLIPPVMERALATVLTYGAAKYGPENWKGLGDFENRYYGALRRHLDAWRDGEDYDLDDKETGQDGSHILHIVQVFINAGFLVWHSVTKRGLKIRLTEKEIKQLRNQI